MKGFLLWSLACLFLVHGSAAGQPAAKEAAGSTLQLCLARAADYSPVYPTQTFPAGSTEEVTAVVRLGEGELHRKLEATWMAVNVGRAAPANQVIRKVTLPVRGDRGAIQLLTRGRPLPPGTYRLDVTADGKPWRTVEFSVAPVEAPAVRQPADLMPLKPGSPVRRSMPTAGSGSRLRGQRSGTRARGCTSRPGAVTTSSKRSGGSSPAPASS